MELSMELYSEFQHSVEPSGIDQVIYLYRHILTLLPLNHADRNSTLLGLSESLVVRFIVLSGIEDLDEAIQALRDILFSLPPPNPARYQYLSYLSFCLFLRFLRTTDSRYFKEAMEISQTETDEHAPARILLERGLTLSRLFRRDSNLLHLEGAIAEYSFYLSLTPKHHPDRYLALTHLSTSYMFRYQRCNEKSDYETALNHSREAVGLLPSSHPLRASILSLHIDVLVEKTLADSHTVLSAVTTTYDQKSMQLLDSLDDIEELIGALREVLELGEARDELYCRRLRQLGEALYLRSVSPHALSRDLNIDQGIDILKKAIDYAKELNQNSYDALMISLTTTLALIYQLRFTRFREISDSETSAYLYREALLHELDIVGKVALTSNLALTLFERFSFNRVSRDIDEAIALTSEILDVSKSSQLGGKTGASLQDAYHLHLKGLGKYLHARFHHQGDPSDIDKSIEALRESMAKQDNHSVRTLLYRALFSRYQLRKSKNDLDELLAIFHDMSLSDLIKSEYIHDQKPNYGETARTGSILLHLFELSGNPAFSKTAQDTCSQGARYSTDGVVVQLENSVVWAHASPYASDSALEAYTLAITLLPQVAAVNLDVQSRQDLLRMTPGIACDAALCAIGAGKIELAVELLSAGRSIFWSQSLNLRNSVEDLQMVAPELAERLRTTSFALETSSLHDLSTLPLLDPASESLQAMEFESIDRRHLHESWHLTLAEIRDKVPGFENFMRPKKFADLQKAAEHGPVVILTAGKAPYGSTYHQNLCERSLDGCIALILTKEGVKHIVLPTFGHPMAEMMGDLLQSALHGTRVSRSMDSRAMMDRVFDTIGIQSRLKLKSPKTQVAGTNLELEDSQEIFRYVLRALWIEVVAPIVNELGLEVLCNTSSNDISP